MSKRCFFPLLSFVLFRFSRVNFSQAKILSSRKNFIVFSSTDFYTPSSVTILVYASTFCVIIKTIHAEIFNI